MSVAVCLTGAALVSTGAEGATNVGPLAITRSCLGVTDATGALTISGATGSFLGAGATGVGAKGSGSSKELPKEAYFSGSNPKLNITYPSLLLLFSLLYA